MVRTNNLYLSICKLYKYYCSVLYILLFNRICFIRLQKRRIRGVICDNDFILSICLERHTAHLLLFDILLSFNDKLLLLFDILMLIIL